MSKLNTVFFSKHRKLKGSREGTEATLSPRTECSMPMPEQLCWLLGCHAPALETEPKTGSSLQCHTHIPNRNSFYDTSKSQVCNLILTLSDKFEF